jgi:ABC-2 type transport system ATP-binding protein
MERSMNAQSEQTPIIATSKLSKHFGDVFAVHEVTFQVPKASIFGLIGPSGSGKTTMIRLLTGIYKPSEGEVTVFEQNPIHFDQEMRMCIGYMPQHFSLYPRLSVYENIRFAASIYGLRLDDTSRLSELLDVAALDGHQHKLVKQLSGGMKRRLSLAASMIHDPDLIFLDEPTAEIDPILRHKFWEYFNNLRENGKTLFITTQYVNEASYCDYVAVLKEGDLIAVETPQRLRRSAYGGDVIEMWTSAKLSPQVIEELRGFTVEGESSIEQNERQVLLVVEDASNSIPDILRWSRENSIEVGFMDLLEPPFEDVFFRLLEKD